MVSVTDSSLGERRTLLAIRLAWLLRADVRRNRSVSDPDAFDDFLVWWAVNGRREYPAWTQLPESVKSLLFEPLAEYPSFGRLGVSRLVTYLLSVRKDVAAQTDLSSQEGIWEMLAWLFAYGLREHHLLDAVDVTTQAALDAPVPFLAADVLDSGEALLTWLMFFLWRKDPAILRAFDIRLARERRRYAAWFHNEGRSLVGLAPVNQEQTQPPPRLQPTWKGLDGSRSSTPSRPALGVNLVGFAYGELGIGEDLRMAAEACERAAIPYSIVGIALKTSGREQDRLLEGRVLAPDACLPYSVNVLCLTAFDTARLFLEQGESLFRDHYNIGWWPWELANWPQHWQCAFDLVDEVWAATEFTFRAYRDAAPPAKSIHRMPLAASVDRCGAFGREHFDLPTERFLYLYVFDCNSYLARKNPLAAVTAFQEAFPDRSEPVGLVLKTMNASPTHPIWQQLEEACRSDSRIVLLAPTLDRPELLALIKACDAYVSLHRSEGFGRTLAEAMLFGKPVVATDYSGNRDFIEPHVAFPVRYHEVPVRSGEYPFFEPDRADWAEPDIQDAAQQMRRARREATQPAWSRRLLAHARDRFSPDTVGAKMRARLTAITEQDSIYPSGGAQTKSASAKNAQFNKAQ